MKNIINISGIDSERLFGLSSYQDFENAMLDDQNFNDRISSFFLTYYADELDIKFNSFGEKIEDWFNTFMLKPLK